MFRLSACDFNEKIYRDGFFADDYEGLPGGWIIDNRNLCLWKDEKDFQVENPDGELVDIKYNIDFIEYCVFWDNCREFGLPHGNGWINELPWVVEFVKMFNRVYNDIEIFRAKKRAKES